MISTVLNHLNTCADFVFCFFFETFNQILITAHTGKAGAILCFCLNATRIFSPRLVFLADFTEEKHFFLFFFYLISPHSSIVFTSTGAVVQLNVDAAVFNISTSAAVFPGRPDRIKKTRNISVPCMETLGVEFSRWRGA